MWILPKQLRTSLCAPDTEALTSDSAAASQACAQSLIVRSKPQRASFYLREWKAGRLTRLRSGLICEPSLGQRFLDAWTSCLADILASHSALQESVSAPTTLGTSGQPLQQAFDFSDHKSVASRTSKDTSRWDSPQSSAIWKSWVTRCRGDYSRRLNAARHTSGSACLSWPTASTRDWKDTPGMARESIDKDGLHRNRTDQLARAVYAHGQAAPAKPSTHGSPRGLLNPDWVETLMGLPVGWTDSACSATESCPQPQSERSEH